jgi:beta-phosphoglucomutase-like phosphatase (HAD superfamily)
MGKLLNQASRAGLRLGVASTANSRTIESALSGALAQNVWELFDTIVGGDQVTRVKPAPDVYLQALKNLQLGTSEVIAIEDSPPGLASAQAAGLVTVICPNAMTCRENFDTAALVLDYHGDHANHTLPSASTQTHASDLIDLDRLAALLG